MILVNHCCLASPPTCHFFNQTTRQPHFQLPKASVGFNPLLNYKSFKIMSAINGQGRVCELFDLQQQLIPYEVAWSWQKEIVKEKKAPIETEGDCTDTLIVLQHPPVYTLGTASSQDNLNFDMKNPALDIHRTERGGEITYDVPGQGTRNWQL